MKDEMGEARGTQRFVARTGAVRFAARGGLRRLRAFWCAARGCLRRARAGKLGLYGAAVAAPRPVGFLPETSPGVASRPAGKSPCAFPRNPFCGAGEKRKRLYCFFTCTAACVNLPLQACSGKLTRGLNARVHSAFCPRAAPPARGKPRSPPARSRATRSH